MAQHQSSNAWTGPSAKEMIASHTLAKEVIQRHGSPEPVFDDLRIVELRRFISDPSKAHNLLKDMDMADREGDKPGDAAAGKGSLTGYIMAKHGTEDPALTDNEIQALKEWFNNSDGKTAAMATA